MDLFTFLYIEEKHIFSYPGNAYKPFLRQLNSSPALG